MFDLAASSGEKTDGRCRNPRTKLELCTTARTQACSKIYTLYYIPCYFRNMVAQPWRGTPDNLYTLIRSEASGISFWRNHALM